MAGGFRAAGAVGGPTIGRVELAGWLKHASSNRRVTSRSNQSLVIPQILKNWSGNCGVDDAETFQNDHQESY